VRLLISSSCSWCSLVIMPPRKSWAAATVFWSLSPLVRMKKLLISGVAGDGSAKASVVDFFAGWHGIGVAIDSAALL